MAPLGGAILAAEILYRQDFETEVIVPAFLASVIGYSIFGLVEGFEPVFASCTTFWNVSQIPLFILLGVVSTAVGLIYINTFYGANRVFKEVFAQFNLPTTSGPLPGHFSPACSFSLLRPSLLRRQSSGLPASGPDTALPSSRSIICSRSGCCSSSRLRRS